MSKPITNDVRTKPIVDNPSSVFNAFNSISTIFTPPAKVSLPGEDSLMEMAKIARVERNAKAENDDDIVVDANRPQLTPSTASAAKKIADGNGNASLYSLLMQLQEIFSNTELASLKTRIQTFAQIAESNAIAIAQSSQAFNDALKVLEAAKERLDAAESEFNAAKDALDAEPNNSALKQAFDAANTARLKATDDASNALDAVTKSVSALPSGALSQLFNPPSQGAKSPAQIMTECMMKLQEIFDKDREASINNRMKLFQERQELLQAELDKKATEYTEAQKNAKFYSEIGTVFAKVLGAFLVFIGSLSSLFSGGTGFLLAAAGIALMVTDESLAAAKKTTVTEAIMGELMKNVIMPIIEKIANAIAEQMKKDGFDPKTAAIVGNVVTALSLLTAVVALVVAGNSETASEVMEFVMSKLTPFIDSIAQKIMTTTAGQTLDNVMTKVGDFASNIIEAVDKALESFAEKLLELNPKLTHETINNALKTMQSVLTFVLTNVETSLKLVIANDQDKALNKMSDMTKIQADLDSIKKQLAMIMQQFVSTMKMPDQFTKQLSNMIETDQQAGNLVLNNSHA